MTSRTVLLIGRRSEQSGRILETHANRLRDRSVADTVRVVQYDDGVEAADLTSVDAADDGPVYAVPMTVARTNETKHAVGAVARSVTDSAILCEPVGRSPVVTDILADRAAEHVAPAADASLVLVGLGSSSLPHQRRVLEYHESRLAARTGFGEVTSSYLLQDPVVECARYNVSRERAVAVPVFVTPSSVTREEIPDKLAVERGGIEYADPIGTDPRLTDAIQAEVAKRRVLGTDGRSTESATGALESSPQRVATDGRGTSH